MLAKILFCQISETKDRLLQRILYILTELAGRNLLNHECFPPTPLLFRPLSWILVQCTCIITLYVHITCTFMSYFTFKLLFSWKICAEKQILMHEGFVLLVQACSILTATNCN